MGWHWRSSSRRYGCRVFGLRGLEQRLGDRLKLLAGASRSAPTRQQTLRAALDWSYGLLSAEEQTTFRHLGVFAGACGFSLDLAGAVAGEAGQDEWAVIEHVSTLLDHSLVVDDGADPPRYRLLESARDYALHQLAERHELDAAEERFARAMNSVMERFDEARWTTPDMSLLSAFARELDNVRLAIGWSLEHDPRLATALVGASSFLYLLLGLIARARALRRGARTVGRLVGCRRRHHGAVLVGSGGGRGAVGLSIGASRRTSRESVPRARR